MKSTGLSGAGGHRRRGSGAAAATLAAAGLLALAACATTGPKPPPPPPADVSDCRSCHAGEGAYPDAMNVYRYWEKSGHGQFAQRPRFRPTCDACHDLAGPAGPAHVDGKAAPYGPNRYHLVPGFLTPQPKNEWDFQVAFDAYCWTACHEAAGVRDMRHERDGTPAAGAVQMGQHASFERVHGDAYPLDGDLSTFVGSSTPPHFVTCVTCHDPHGSGAKSRTGNSNRMAREDYKQPPRMCSRCHI